MAQPVRIEVHGHRGARAVLPENTLPAFEHAIAAGADVLELDLAVTRDDVLVVSHDSVINAAICRGALSAGAAGGDPRPIREMTLAEVRAWDCGAVANPQYPKQRAVPGTKMPTLDEVFALAPKGKFHFNVETKIDPRHPDHAPTPARFVELVLAAIRKHKLESRVILQSFDFRTLAEMKRRAPEIRLAALTATGDYVALTRGAGAGIASPHYSQVTNENVAAAHAAGLRVVPWTANDPAEWKRLAAARVDGIITDDPAALIAYLNSLQ